MATKYSRITRSVSEFRYFLDYYNYEYEQAYQNIQPTQGWDIPYYKNDFYKLVNTLYLTLYDNIYRKLQDDDPTPDEQILELFKSCLKNFEDDTSLFKNIIGEREKRQRLRVLKTVEGIVQELLMRAIYKLREVIQLAEEDIIRFKNATNEEIAHNKESDGFLIGIVTATTSEFRVVKDKLTEVIQLPTSENDSQIYYSGTIQGAGKRLKVIFTQCHHQGTAAASTTTTKLILRFKPDLVVMLGHAAGNKNLVGSLNLGDILICSESSDYDQVTITEKTTNGPPEIREKERKISVPADPTLLNLIENFAANQNVLDSIKELSSVKSLIPTQLGFKLGKLISGDALVRSEAWFQKIIGDNAGAIGLDMETYGVYYATRHTVFKNKPLFLSIKSVSDFGSHRKDFPEGLEDPTNRVAYAIHTSVEFFFKFALEHLPI